MRKLKERCYSCGKPSTRPGSICPYCEAEIGAPPPPRRAARRRRRRQPTPSEEPASAEAAHLALHALTHPTRGDPMERTLILVKPDAFARNLTGEIIARFERKGLRSSRCST